MRIAPFWLVILLLAPVVALTVLPPFGQLMVTLAGIYGQTSVEFTPVLRGVLGLRADYVRNQVESLSLAANSGRSSASLVVTGQEPEEVGAHRFGLQAGE